MDITEKVEVLSISNHRPKPPTFVHGSSLPQYFPLPKFTMDYILKNPKTSDIWKKLIRTCKWFFDKNPIVVVPCLHIDDTKKFFGFNTCSAGYCNQRHDRFIKLANNSYKLWVTQVFDMKERICICSANLFIPHIFKCDATEVEIMNQVLNFEEFQFLTSKVIDLVFIPWNFDGFIATVPFEEMLESLPNVKYIRYSFIGSEVTPYTVKKFAEMEHVKKFSRMELLNIPPTFDFDAFLKFMTENKQILFTLTFHDDIITTEKHMVKVKAFVEKLFNENYVGYPFPQFPQFIFDDDSHFGSDEEDDGNDENNQ